MQKCTTVSITFVSTFIKKLLKTSNRKNNCTTNITIIPQEVNVGVDRMCYAIYRITEDLYQPLYNGKVDSLVDSYEETVEAALKYCLENLI